MSVGLIYGKATGQLRKVVVDCPDYQMGFHMAQGEALIIVDDATYATLIGSDALQDYLNGITQKHPSTDVLAVMADANGMVISQHIADPGCDAPFPGHSLVWSSAAQPGWLYVGRRFHEYPPTRRVYTSPRALRGRIGAAAT